MTTTQRIVKVTDDATRADLAEAIAHLRAKAQRYSRHDPRRTELDDEIDLLVAEWLVAPE